MKPSMISNPARRVEVTIAEPRWKTKFGLRIAIMVLDFISIVTTAAVPSNQGLFLVFNFIPLGVSFFWCMANIIVRTRRARPMHPGANVAMDLLIWLTLLGLGVFEWWLIYGFFTQYNYFALEDETVVEYRKWAQVQSGSLAVATLVAGLHILLFVWACIDTSKRNKAETESRRIVIQKKLETKRSSQQNSGWQPDKTPQYPIEYDTYDPRSRGPAYSSLEDGSRSLGRPVSPLGSPGPSSPAPAYLSGPVSPPMDPKRGSSLK